MDIKELEKKDSDELAKIGGITPLMLIFNGRWLVCPP